MQTYFSVVRVYYKGFCSHHTTISILLYLVPASLYVLDVTEIYSATQGLQLHRSHRESTAPEVRRGQRWANVGPTPCNTSAY